jgi:hypothetical protein
MSIYYLDNNKTLWRKYAKESHQSNRQNILNTYLDKVVGIYNDKKLVKRYNLEKTIWINVLESKDELDNLFVLSRADITSSNKNKVQSSKIKNQSLYLVKIILISGS